MEFMTLSTKRYKSSENDHISFEIGELIKVSPDKQANNLWYGTKMIDKQSGFFPKSHVNPTGGKVRSIASTYRNVNVIPQNYNNSNNYVPEVTKTSDSVIDNTNFASRVKSLDSGVTASESAGSSARSTFGDSATIRGVSKPIAARIQVFSKPEPEIIRTVNKPKPAIIRTANKPEPAIIQTAQPKPAIFRIVNKPEPEIIRTVGKTNTTRLEKHLRTSGIDLLPSNHVLSVNNKVTESSAANNGQNSNQSLCVSKQLSTTNKNGIVPLFPPSAVIPKRSSGGESPQRSEGFPPAVAMSTFNNNDIDFNDFSDDSFESDDEITKSSNSVNGFKINHSKTSPNIASLSQQLCLSINRFAQNRLNIIYEMIATEEAYIKDIYFTLEHFRKSLFDCRLFPDDEIESFFSNLDQIYSVNYALYSDLSQRLQRDDNASEKKFGDILLTSLQQMLPIYKLFCSEQMISSKNLQNKLENDAQFNEVLQNISLKTKTHLPISSYLLKPMQRITKYPLLIEKLFESTPQSHPDHRDCNQALNFAKSFCKEINEACRKTENFDKLIWLQKHINISWKIIDHVIDFNSETRFLGPRKLLHSGILIKASSSKVLAAFLFNDFLLLAIPDKKFPKSLINGTNFFFNQKTLDTTYTLYRKPLLLDEFNIADMPEFESNTDPGMFRIFVIPKKRHLLFRTNSTDDCVLWLKTIIEAKKNYKDIERKLVLNENNQIECSPFQIPIGVLLITIEALQLYTNNYALNAYCKVAIGKNIDSIQVSKQTNVSRLEISKNTLSRKAKNNMANKDGSFKITWNCSIKLNIFNFDQTLFISCHEENPYAPHQCLGEAHISLADIIQQRKFVNGSITKNLPLQIPNPQMSISLFNNYNNPSVLIKYDLDISIINYLTLTQ